MATITAESKGIYAKLVVTEQSQSIDSNTTVLAWQVYMWNTTGTWYAYTDKNRFAVKINGTYAWNTDNYGTVSLQNGITEANAKLMASGTMVVAHAADGTKMVALELYAAQGWGSPPLWEWSATGSVQLTQISRASQPSCITYPTTTSDVGYIGDTIRIHMNRASTNFTHIVSYRWDTLGESSPIIIAQNVTDNCSWSIPWNLAQTDYMKTHTVGTGVIYVDTYNGSTYIGRKSVTFTAHLPDSVIPTEAITLEAVNPKLGLYVKGYSKVKVTASANGIYNSSISKYVVSFNGKVTNNCGNPWTSEILTSPGNYTLYHKAIDSRGRETTIQQKTITVYDYYIPLIGSFHVSRTSAGDTVTVYTEFYISSVGGKNSVVAARLYYKLKTSTSWSVYSSADLISGKTITLSGFATTYSYDFKLEITDAIGNKTVAEAEISTEVVTLDLKKGGTGVGIGKIAELDDTLDVGLAAIFRKGVHAYINGIKYDLGAAAKLAVDSGWVSITLASGISTIDYIGAKVRKIGNVVNLIVGVMGATKAFQLIGTLPEGYRPPVEAIICARYYNSPNTCVSIQTDGAIKLLATATGATEYNADGAIEFTVTYFV